MTARRGVVMGAVALSVVGMVAAYRLGKARADGVPAMNPLYYGGVLNDGGRPVEGTRNVTVRLWNAATAGATVCSTMAAGTTFTGGRFRVALDGACVGAVRANPELWAEVQVEGATFPRSKLGAVPYALEAGRATAAAGALEARIAAVEGRAAGRQRVIGSWRPASAGRAEQVVVPCPAPLPSAPIRVAVPGPAFTLTFVAAASGLYRVWATVSGTDSRVDAVPSLPLVFNRNAGGSGRDAVFQLEAGRSYTFAVSIEARPTCSGSAGTLDVELPMMAEQLE